VTENPLLLRITRLPAGRRASGFVLIAKGLPNRRAPLYPGDGRTWWAHFDFTRINITPTILRKKMEDLPRDARPGVHSRFDPAVAKFGPVTVPSAFSAGQSGGTSFDTAALQRISVFRRRSFHRPPL